MSYVLILAVVSLGLMIFASGWEINHSELRATVIIPDVSTPPEWPQAHMIINHFPTVGFMFAIAFLISSASGARSSRSPTRPRRMPRRSFDKSR